MTLAALILPLFVPSAPPITVQLHVYETGRGMAFNGSDFVRTGSRENAPSLLFNPTSPTEAQLEEQARNGEIKALGNPVIKTLSGTEGVIKTSREDTLDGETTTVEQSFSVRPLLSKENDVTLRLSASIKQMGEEPQELLNSSTTFSIREGKSVYILAPMKGDRKRSLLISVRVFTGS